MAILAFVLIAHEEAERVGRTIDALLQVDRDCLVAVHYDRNSPTGEFLKLKRRYEGHGSVLFVEKRVRCGWGQFGLVEGVIRALRLLEASKLSYTHAYLVSCSCWPIRSTAGLRQFLDDHSNIDFIESYDESWMTGGLRGERYTLRHPFSFTRHRWLFEKSVALQRRLGFRRRIPAGLKPRYGSQWWCLRRETVRKILNWVTDNPSPYQFFRHVWISDETFFQTVINSLTNVEISNGYIPTLYKFNAYGKPIVFYDDHLSWLTEQPHFFARKVADSAVHCRAVLLERASQPEFRENGLEKLPPGIGTIAKPVAKKENSRYGRIFEPNSGVRNWGRNLSIMGRDFAVLYGPPVLTEIAATALTGRSNLTVHGRLFRKDKIEFVNNEHVFFGLNSNEISIRDYDRALYLQRVVQRSPHFPIFQLCPGDDPAFEQSIFDASDLIAVPLIPGIEASWRSLFWYLSLPEDERMSINQEAERAERLRRIEGSAALRFDRKYMTAMEKRLFGPSSRLPAITLSAATKPVDPAWEQSQLFLHGTKVESFLEGLRSISVEFSQICWQDLAPDLALKTKGEDSRG